MLLITSLAALGHLLPTIDLEADASTFRSGVHETRLTLADL